jgi:hypothetical protein
MDAANIIKPALARGELQCIGATTLSEYAQANDPFADVGSYAGKWVTGSERAAYRGGCRSLPELPKGTIRHEEDYRHHRLSSAGICG